MSLGFMLDENITGKERYDKWREFFVITALVVNDGFVNKSAEFMGVSDRCLRNWMGELEINAADYKKVEAGKEKRLCKEKVYGKNFKRSMTSKILKAVKHNRELWDVPALIKDRFYEQAVAGVEVDKSKSKESQVHEYFEQLKGQIMNLHEVRRLEAADRYKAEQVYWELAQIEIDRIMLKEAPKDEVAH